MAEELKVKGMYFSDRCQFCHDFGEKVEPYLCSDCKGRIYKLGYRKVSGEPPVLGDEEIKAIEAEAALRSLVIKSKDEIRLIKKRAIAQAQRDADVKYYNKPE